MIIRVCDLGGTHCRIGQYADGRLAAASVARFRNEDYPSFAALMMDYHARTGVAPAERLMIALAAPVTGDVVALTNLDWTIDRREIGEAVGVPQVFLINDFEALGHALSAPHALHSVRLQEGSPSAAGTRLILGAGTGFNCAARLANGSVVICEAGHSTFVAETELDHALQARISQQHGRCSNDRVLSGSGLAEVYRTVCDLEGKAPRHAGSRQIVPAALEQGDPLALRACEEFARMLGRAAGDLALVFLATGGVHVTAGMAQALHRLITGPDSRFLQAFRAKGRMAATMELFPVQLVLDDNAALLGCHEYQASAAGERAAG